VVHLGTIVMGVTDVRRAADFWMAALGYEPRRGDIDDDWTILDPPGGDGPGLALDRSETVPATHPHVHLDLYAADAAEQAAEIERLVALGATRIDWDRYPAEPDFVVLADTEGNRFCVIDCSHGEATS
jgi:predicted enzyme related to lactoylglutathione lyase